MTNGPPSTSAGPSYNPHHYPAPVQNQVQSSNYYTPHGQTPRPAHQQPQPSSNTPYPSQSYFNTNYPSAWQQNAWQVPTNPYSPGATSYQQQTYNFPQVPYPQYQSERPQPLRFSAQIPSHSPPKPKAKIPAPVPKVPTPSPSPSPPPPEFYRHWDSVIVSFLSSLGLSQAVRGFENDMLVVNEDWERQKVPKAIGE